MPYISVRSTKMSDDKIQTTVDDITDIISDVLGKGVDTIMVDVEKIDNLFLGKKKIDAGAMVQIQAYGKSPSSAKEKLNSEIVAFFEDVLGIGKANVYITFTDRSEWGYKGMFLMS